MFDVKAIRQLRLQNQLLTKPAKSKPEDVVKHLVAVQSQDFFGALWAVGQRLEGATLADVELAFNEGRILRTHVMRPTWHFVVSEDIRWLLKLTSPRVNAMIAYMDRQTGLDAKLLASSHKLLAKALIGNEPLTRRELKAYLEKAKIPTTNLQMTHIVMHAELNGLICSGPRRGKQFTYALLEERVPKQSKEIGR